MFMSKDAFDKGPPGAAGPQKLGSQSSGASDLSNASYGRHGRPNTGSNLNYFRPTSGPGAGRTYLDNQRPGLSTAGALPAGESRAQLLERQAQLQREKRMNRMSGGPISSTSRGAPMMTRTMGGPMSTSHSFKSTPSFSSKFSDSSMSASNGELSARAMEPRNSHAQNLDDLPTLDDEVVTREAGGGGGGGQSPEKAAPIRPLFATVDGKPANREQQKEVRDELSSVAVSTKMREAGIADSFDPEPATGLGTSSLRASIISNYDARSLDLSDMRSFITSPAPRSAGVIQCYIERDKSSFGKRIHPVYQLYMKDGDKFMLAGKKRGKNRTANYLISADKSDLNRKSSNFMGKLRSNFVGTSFTVFDNGEAPKDFAKHKKSKGSGDLRKEIACVTYAKNVMGSKGPRKMRVAVPQLDERGQPLVFAPTVKDETRSLTRVFKDGDTSELVCMINKPPKWNEQVNAYVLNFNGRVTMASVKNFQLVSPDNQEVVLLQFGRVGKDLFTMDYRWPLSALQAFAICLSSFDHKLACE